LSGVALQSSIQPGFGDAVAGSQSVFRSAMDAMARPGTRLVVDAALAPPAPLNATAAALLLTLCDFETSVWLDPPLADSAGVAAFLRFHTGARLVAAAQDAAYAIVSDTGHMPPLASFAQGTPEYPDRSATLILQVRELKPTGWKLEGPGIRGHALFSASPLPADFVQQARANRAQFPCGVDMFFTTAAEIAALPRSARLTEIA
jgi:alpha-D-ribose 1-methylphosphonate 5-triphosphate synthase subunit PhnH